MLSPTGPEINLSWKVIQTAHVLCIGTCVVLYSLFMCVSSVQEQANIIYNSSLQKKSPKIKTAVSIQSKASWLKIEYMLPF